MTENQKLAHWLYREGANCQKHLDCANAIEILETKLNEANERADELGADKGTYFRLYEQACIRMTEMQAKLDFLEKKAK